MLSNHFMFSSNFGFCHFQFSFPFRFSCFVSVFGYCCHWFFTETWFVFPRHDYVNEYQNRHAFVDDEKAHGRGGEGVSMRHLLLAADWPALMQAMRQNVLLPLYRDVDAHLRAQAVSILQVLYVKPIIVVIGYELVRRYCWMFCNTFILFDAPSWNLKIA